MANVPMDNLGGLGIIKDRPPYSLPPGAWSDGRNVRMNEGAVEKFLGHSDIFGTPTVVPYFLLPVQTTSVFYWMYASLTKCYVTDGVIHTDITRAPIDGGDFSATADENWTGVVMGGIPVINNGVDDPQMWNPVSVSTTLTDLTAWPAATQCKTIRAFKTFLIALDVTKSSVNYPRLVKWSHSSSFNAVPTSWDETDATLDAGEYELAGTRGDVIDGLELNDSFIIYKDDSIYGMQFVGAPLVFRFYDITKQVGVFSKRCVVEFEGGHFVFGHNDCVVTDGQTVRSVLDKRNRKALYGAIDTTYYKRSFVVANRSGREIWICYPSHGSEYCNQALVWNWAEDSYGVRDLPNVLDGKYGIADVSSFVAGPTWAAGSTTWAAETAAWDDTAAGDDWANATMTWDSIEKTWDEKLYNPTENSLVFAGTSDTKIYLADDTNQENGSNMTSFIERTGLQVGSPDNLNEINRIIPDMEASGPVNFYVGGQMATRGPVTWQGPYSFDPNSQHKVDCRVRARLMALKVESDSNIDWKLNGLDIKLADTGAGQN